MQPTSDSDKPTRRPKKKRKIASVVSITPYLPKPQPGTPVPVPPQAPQSSTWATAYTDASYSRGRAGWAVWLRSGYGRIVLAGQCPEYVEDSMAAETYAVYKAIEIATSNWRLDGMQVNTDCGAILKSFWPWSPPLKNPVHRKIQKMALRAAAENGIHIRTKHVKAHTRGDDVRSYLNSRVDELSKKKRREVDR